MHDESYNDHEREDAVDCKGDRKIWDAKVGVDGTPKLVVRSCDLVDEHDTHCCVSNFSPWY